MPADGPARVRFAPSPTGWLHIGGARAALYNFLVARQTGGQFILRIEDTDRKRFQPQAEQDFMDGLRWLGLEWDEGPDKGGPYGPYRQTERAHLYRQYAEQLVEQGHAYYCFCSPERLAKLREEQRRKKLPPRYDGHCRHIPPEEAKRRVEAGEPHVIRFKTPREGSITVHDLIRGDITVANKDIDDYILLKSDGLPTYHLAVVVDDHLMRITHVLRGAEWLGTFPLHGHLYRAFGWPEPVWVHLSTFLKPSGKGKISKRDADVFRKGHKSVLIRDLRAFGYLPEAVNNWMALMGWSYDDRTEFFTLDDLIAKFSLERLKPSPAAVNFKKLDHFQGLHVRALEPGDLARRLVPFFHRAGYPQVTAADLLPIVPLIQTRITTLDEAPQMAGFFFRPQVSPKPEELVPKGLTPAQALEVARRALAVLEALPDVRAETTEPPLRALVEELGLHARQVFGLIRVAVTGQRVSPPLFESMEILGRETVLQRMRQAVTLLETLAQQEAAA